MISDDSAVLESFINHGDDLVSIHRGISADTIAVKKTKNIMLYNTRSM